MDSSGIGMMIGRYKQIQSLGGRVAIACASPKVADIIALSGLVLDVKAHKCTLNDQPLSLTPTEFSILEILIQNKGNVVSSEDLFHQIWKDEYYTKSNNTITAHIRHLREKMGDSYENPKYIKTVWGYGYKIED